MRVKIQCDVPGCGATCWARGWEESDTNAMGVDDRDELEDACEHVKAGGSYAIIDWEYETPDFDEDYQECS